MPTELHVERRRWLIAAGAVATAGGSVLLPAVLPGEARAQYAAREGKEFRRVGDPKNEDAAKFLTVLRSRNAASSKVEVLEFFQYSCPHCYSFTPDLERWRSAAGADVEYRRVPIHWDDSTLNHTKLFFALRKLGKHDSLHEKIFAAFHNAKRRLIAPNEIADFAANNGIDRKAFLDAFNSDEIAKESADARLTWQAYSIDATPALGVDAKYVTSPSMVGTKEGGIGALTAVVLRARSERAAKKS